MKRILLFALLLLAIAVPTWAADIYWNKDGADAHWDTVTGNWWDDDGFTEQAGDVPQTGDFVYLRGATTPDSAPSVAVALSGFDTQGLTASAYVAAVTANVSIQAGGTLTMGDPAAPGYAHEWGGTTAAAGTFTFNDNTSNWGTVGDSATFNDASSIVDGTAGDYATFNDLSLNSGTVGDYATFNGSSWSASGSTVGDHATFNTDEPQCGSCDFTGTTYYLAAATTFADICLFTGTPPIEFQFTGTAADLIGTITSDGGSTPITYNINVNAAGLTVTAQRNLAPYTFTMTVGTFAGNSQTYTVGAGGFTFTDGTISGTLDVDLSTAAGGFEMTGGTLTGTLNVDLSGSTGAYAQTDGTIDTDAVLNVRAGFGGFSVTAITMTGSVNITQADSSTAVGWTTSATALTCLTVETAEITLADHIFTKKCVNNGTITAGAYHFRLWRPPANNFWSGSGTFTGTSTASGIQIGVARSNTAAIIWDAPMNISTTEGGDGAVLTASGGITCGNLVVQGPDTAGEWGGLTIPASGQLSCADLTFGAAATDRSGKVTLGPGVHRATGAIAVAGDGNAQALSLRGRLILGGTFTGTNITVTTVKEGEIDAEGVGRVTAVTATGRRLVVWRAVDGSGNPVRSWDGDGCTNVRFRGRKIFGVQNGLN